MKLKHAIVVLAAAGALSTQALAGEAQVQQVQTPAQSLAAFTEADLQVLFDNADQPMQLAVLSAQEMHETEGAAFNPWGAAGGAIWGGGAAMMNQIGHRRPVHQWNWGTIGSAAFMGGLTGGFAHMGPVARHVIPRIGLGVGFGSGLMGW